MLVERQQELIVCNDQLQKSAQIIFGLTGSICSGQEEVVQYLLSINPKTEICNLNQTFREELFFEEIVKQAINENLPFEILELENEEVLNWVNLVQGAFKKFYNPEADVERLSQTLERWTIPQIIYPIVNDFQTCLLQQRNYFHLVSVEAPTMVRYKYFQKKYPKMAEHINLALFTLIDDEISSQIIDSSRFQSKAQVYFKGDQESLKQSIDKWEQKIFREIRPSIQEYFMYMAQIVKVRSNCMKRAYQFTFNKNRVGAVIVKRDRIIATGYNGTPYGKLNCFEGGCQRCNSNTSQGQDLERCFCFHAEENAILEIGTKKSQGTTLYTTTYPCYQCSKIIIAAGVKELYYEETYNDRNATSILANIIIVRQISTQYYVH